MALMWHTFKVTLMSILGHFKVKYADFFNPLPTGAEYIGLFTQLLPHSVPPFRHVKAIM